MNQIASNMQKLNIPWVSLLSVGILAGIYATFKVLFGQHHFLAANDTIIWTLPISTYVFFAITSTGMGLLGSLPKLLGVEALNRWARRLTFMAIVTLLGAFISIGLELGAVTHMIYLMFSPNFTSPIWWMGVLYSLELALLIYKFIVEGREGKTPPALSAASAIVGVIAVMVLGSVFGLAESRPVYFGAYMPIYTLSMSLVAAWATISVYDAISPIGGAEPTAGMGRTLKATLILSTAVAFARLVLAMANTKEAFSEVAGIWPTLGLLLALLLMLPAASKVSRGIRGFAAGLTLVSVFTLTVSIIVAGQAMPIGPKAENAPAILSYAPNIGEVLVFIFSASVVLLLYHLGDRLLQIDPKIKDSQ